MCIACHMRDSKRWSFQGYWGQWSNFLPRRRGEGNPAPWLLLRTERVGLQIQLSRVRPWLRPKLNLKESSRAWILGQGKVGTYITHPVSSFIWGFFILAWRPQS